MIPHSIVDISNLIKNGTLCDFEVGDKLDSLSQKGKKNDLIFSHEFPDGVMYYYTYKKIELELLFTKDKVLFCIMIRIIDSEINYYIETIEAKKIKFEELINFFVLNNISWKFIRNRVYNQVINILLDNGLIITFQFKGNSLESNSLIFLSKEHS